MFNDNTNRWESKPLADTGVSRNHLIETRLFYVFYGSNKNNGKA